MKDGTTVRLLVAYTWRHENGESHRLAIGREGRVLYTTPTPGYVVVRFPFTEGDLDLAVAEADVAPAVETEIRIEFGGYHGSRTMIVGTDGDYVTLPRYCSDPACVCAITWAQVVEDGRLIDPATGRIYPRDAGEPWLGGAS